MRAASQYCGLEEKEVCDKLGKGRVGKSLGVKWGGGGGDAGGSVKCGVVGHWGVWVCWGCGGVCSEQKTSSPTRHSIRDENVWPEPEHREDKPPLDKQNLTGNCRHRKRLGGPIVPRPEFQGERHSDAIFLYDHRVEIGKGVGNTSLREEKPEGVGN